MPRERKPVLPRLNEDILATRDVARARLAALVRSSADAIVGETLEGIITDWNPAAERLYGYRAEEVIGQHLAAVIPADRMAEAEAILDRVRRGESVAGLETVRRTRDGRTIHVALTMSPVWDDAGALIATSAIVRDINAAKASEARYRAVVEQVPAVIYTEQHGTEPVVTFMSPYVETILGIPAEAFMADHGLWLERVHPDDRDRVQAAEDQMRGSSAPFAADYRMIAADGRTVWIRDVATLEHDDAGRPLCWQGVALDITEHRQLERELQTSEAKYRALVEHLPAVVYVQANDERQTTTYFSPRFEALTGFALAEALDQPAGEHWHDFLHPDDRARVAADESRSIASGELFRSEYRLMRRDGSYVWVRDECVPVHDDAGAVVAWQGVLLDITEQIQAEQALAASEGLFRAAFENAPIGMLVASPDLNRLQVNRALCEMLGYTEEELLAMNPLDVTHPDDIAPNRAFMQRALAGEISSYELEKRYIHRDGHIVWGHLNGSLVRDQAGTPRYFVSQIQDITARKATDDALAASEERFRLAFENAPIGMALVASDQRPLQVNRALCAMLGYTEAELLHTTLRALTHPDDVPANLALVEGALAGDLEGFALEKRYVRKDGEILWAALTASFVRDETGAPLYFISQIQDISERKAAEAEFAETHQHTRQVLERITDGFYALDRDWRFTYINAAAERIFGRPRDEMIGKNVWTEFASALETPVYAAYLNAMVEGTAIEVEFFYPAFNAWYQVNVYPSIDGLSVFFRDVTEQRRLIQELRASEEKFRTLVEQLPVVVYLLAADAPQTRLYFSPYFETLTGYSPEEALAHSDRWLDWVHPEDRQRVGAAETETSATEEPLRIEYRHRRQDGSYLWVRDECVPIFDDAGVLVAWQGVLLDITDRKQAEEAQARLAAIVESAEDAVISSRDGVITSWNHGAEKLYGYRTEEIVGQPDSILIPDERMDELVAQAHESGDWATQFETVRRRQDGTDVAVAISLSPIYDRHGAMIGVSSITRDITARKSAEEALRSALDAAQTASRAKSQFLAMMSHELRTPLQAVVGYAEVLLAGQGGALTAEQREDIDYIHQGGRRMMALIGQMLDLSRIEAGALQVAIAPIDLGTILEQVRQDVALQAEAKGLHLVIEAPPGLPAVLGDALHLRQILLNLVGNAVKFTEQGSVRVSATATREQVTVMVQDTGMGIAAAALPHIFEEFRQVDSSLTRRHGGAGLGLAIAQKLAGLMGSRITVESESGVGSTFTLHLTRARPSRGTPRGKP